MPEKSGVDDVIWIALAAIAVLGFLAIWQSYMRDHEREGFATERQQWVTERRDLNNRIQIPQVAAFMEDETTEVPAYVPFDDDDAYHDAVEEMGRVEG